MVGFVFASESREDEMEAPTKEGWSAHTDSEGAHSVVGRDGGARRCWPGIRSEHQPGTLLSQQGGATRVRTMPSWRRGSMLC
jgi:hypothetical protein